MGSDPRRLDGLRPDERVAALLLEHATGGTVRAHDIGTRQGAYDLHLTLPGGRTAAVEVTTHEALPPDLTDLLCVPHVARRVAKVTAARGVDERHLFVGIGAGALPDAGRPPTAEPAPLSGGRGSVTEQTEVPQGLTRVWVTTVEPGAPLRSWSRPEGWRDHST